MIWRDFSKAFKDGDHSFLSPSQHAWYNYDDEKLVKTYISKMAAAKGTALHALARNLINLKVRLPDTDNTLNMYVNDSIDFRMRPEEKLYYSRYCFGTTDAISFEDYLLRISDLKTGKTKVSFLQLEIYAALFFLCYPEIRLSDIKDIELRIYQNNEAHIKHPGVDDILPIMDKIKRSSKMLERLEEEYGNGFDSDSFGSWS